MTSLRLSAALAAAFAVSTPALAGGLGTPQPDPYVPAPPVVVAQPELSWTGASVGARLGYGRAELTTPGGNVDDDGVIGGVSAAYDYDFGTLVVGAGISADATDISLAGVDIDYVGRAGLRVGADLGSSLVYGTGGYARAELDGAADADGYYAGIGSETRLTERLTLGSELLYHEFDDVAGAGNTVDALTANLSLNLRF